MDRFIDKDKTQKEIAEYLFKIQYGQIYRRK